MTYPSTDSDGAATEVTVLVVDDNEDNIDLLEDSLGSCGFRVHVARSGVDAMSLLMSHRVDVVLLDLMMPDMNGFATLEMIRFVPRLMDMPVVVHTAYPSEMHVRRARDLGAEAVLTKPLPTAELAKALRKAIAESGSQTAAATD
jgi:CheY-like chemotaxis protein